jgi:hypothetical protein
VVTIYWSSKRFRQLPYTAGSTTQKSNKPNKKLNTNQSQSSGYDHLKGCIRNTILQQILSSVTKKHSRIATKHKFGYAELLLRKFNRIVSKQSQLSLGNFQKFHRTPTARAYPALYFSNVTREVNRAVKFVKFNYPKYPFTQKTTPSKFRIPQTAQRYYAGT